MNDIFRLLNIFFNIAIIKSTDFHGKFLNLCDNRLFHHDFIDLSLELSGYLIVLGLELELGIGLRLQLGLKLRLGLDLRLGLRL